MTHDPDANCTMPAPTGTDVFDWLMGEGFVMERNGLPIIPPLPPGYPLPTHGPVAQCGECGRKIGAVDGYVCNNRRCPVYPQITCFADPMQSVADEVMALEGLLK